MTHNSHTFRFGEGFAICTGLQQSNITLQAPNDAKQVNDYSMISIKQNVQLTCLFLEILLSYLRGDNVHRINDFATSVTTYFPKLALYSVTDYCYTWAYHHFHIIDVRWDSPLAKLALFVAVDFVFYWYHRIIHEVNIFWAFHQIHHSSEELNLTIGYRQPIIQDIVMWIFYLPFAFFVNPTMMLLQIYISSSIMYFLHTQYVSNLGPLEYILNTPSHHRVHHGRNPDCVDKNYGGIFIIFDRIFGTFEPEPKEEALAYGLVHPIRTFDEVSVQFGYFVPMFRKFFGMQGVRNKLKVLFYGPGWNPGKPRTGDIKDIPKVEVPAQKYDVLLPLWLQCYLVIHFTMFVITYNRVSYGARALGTESLFRFAYCLFTLSCFGRLFDHRKWCYVIEFFRIISLLVSEKIVCSPRCERLERSVLLPMWTCRMWYHVSVAIWITVFVMQKTSPSNESATRTNDMNGNQAEHYSMKKKF